MDNCIPNLNLSSYYDGYYRSKTSTHKVKSGLNSFKKWLQLIFIIIFAIIGIIILKSIERGSFLNYNQVRLK